METRRGQEEHEDELRWALISRCSPNGEYVPFRMTDREKQWVESRPGFSGWEKGELLEVS